MSPKGSQQAAPLYGFCFSYCPDFPQCWILKLKGTLFSVKLCWVRQKAHGTVGNIQNLLNYLFLNFEFVVVRQSHLPCRNMGYFLSFLPYPVKHPSSSTQGLLRCCSNTLRVCLLENCSSQTLKQSSSFVFLITK